jgi:small subunit ribosomal protein S9
LAKQMYNWGTGRRKTAVARVRIKPGTGNVTINDRELSEFFVRERDRSVIHAPLSATELTSRFDVIAKVNGGGIASQAGAVMLGIARALVDVNAEHYAVLRGKGLLTRDSRQKERKKYGRRGARRGFQFSKR